MKSSFEVKLEGPDVNDLKVLQEEQTIEVFAGICVKVVGGVDRHARVIADNCEASE